MNQVVIGVGSNIDPDRHVSRAREILTRQFPGLRSSRFVRTAPVGYTEQADFYNGAFLIETACSEAELKRVLRSVENELGRVRGENKYGPRTIDLDIVVWNGNIIDQDFYTRDFLKNAVCELLPNLSRE